MQNVNGGAAKYNNIKKIKFFFSPQNIKWIEFFLGV